MSVHVDLLPKANSMYHSLCLYARDGLIAVPCSDIGIEDSLCSFFQKWK